MCSNLNLARGLPKINRENTHMGLLIFEKLLVEVLCKNRIKLIPSGDSFSKAVQKYC